MEAKRNFKKTYSERLKFENPDECYTPEYAIKILIPYLKKEWIIWDCAYGSGRLIEHFNKNGFISIGKKEADFFKENIFCDIIITNPPYSKKDLFLKRAFEINKPFAFLLPLTTLEGMKRGKMFKENDIQIIIPNKRINFEISSGKKSCWFATAWFCYKMNLPKQLNFVKLDNGNQSQNGGIDNGFHCRL